MARKSIPAGSHLIANDSCCATCDAGSQGCWLHGKRRSETGTCSPALPQQRHFTSRQIWTALLRWLDKVRKDTKARERATDISTARSSH